MRFDDPAADRQAEPGAANALVAGTLDAEELVEDARDRVGGDTDAAVLDADLQRLMADDARRQADLTTPRRVLTRVGQQIGEYLLDAIWLHEGLGEIGRAVEHDRVSGIVGHEGRGIRQQRADIGWPGRKLDDARFQPLEVEQVVQKAGDAHRLVAHREQVLALLGTRPLVAEQELRKTNERGE